MKVLFSSIMCLFLSGCISSSLVSATPTHHPGLVTPTSFPRPTRTGAPKITLVPTSSPARATSTEPSYSQLEPAELYALTVTPWPDLENRPVISPANAAEILPLREFAIRANQVIWTTNKQSLVVAGGSGLQLLHLPALSAARAYQIEDEYSNIQSASHVKRVALSTDGSRLAAVFGGSFQQWDFETGRPIWVNELSSYYTIGYPNPACVEYSPNGLQLGVCFGSQVSLFGPDYKLITRLGSHPTTIYELNRDIAFNHQGTILAVVGDYSEARLWSTESGALVDTFETGAPAGYVIYRSAGQELLIVTVEQIQIWDLDSRSIIQSVELDRIGIQWPTSFALSSSESIAALGTSEGRILLVDLLEGELVANLDKHIGPVRSLSFSPEDSLLASSSYVIGSQPLTKDSWLVTYEEEEFFIWGVPQPD